MSIVYVNSSNEYNFWVDRNIIYFDLYVKSQLTKIQKRNQRENKNSYTTDSPVSYDTSGPPSPDPTGCKQSKVLQKDVNRIVANA